MKKILRLLFSFTIFCSLFLSVTDSVAQSVGQFVVKGVVADEATKEGEQYATMKRTCKIIKWGIRQRLLLRSATEDSA